jgi:hypothetical protein
MGRKIVDIAVVELNGQELQTVRSLSVNKADPKTAVKVMRRLRRALGFTRGVPDYTASLEVVLLHGDLEVDWDALQKSGEEFTITYERGIDGKRRSLIDCVVGDITEPYDEGGETRVSVSLVFLDERDDD